MLLFFYLLPFSYFFHTRLLGSSLAFHATFELGAALVVVALVRSGGFHESLATSGLNYLAFVCLYEVGYLVNDLISAKREEGGRRRGPQSVGSVWLSAWISGRLLFFVWLTWIMGRLTSLEWWSYFAALSFAFGIHNALRNSEFKTVTFLWLSWFRLMAPIIFVVEDSQRLGVGLAAAMGYSVFRSLGYMDSKGLLRMPGRKRSEYRLLFFVFPLVGALALWPYSEAEGFLALSAYFSLAAISGTIVRAIRPGGKR